MKIALIGYGKMGKAIESIALSRGHEIVTRLDLSNSNEWQSEALRTAEVAIEFTGPESAPVNIKNCIDRSLPVVSGSTGWLSAWQEINQYCQEKNETLLYASNFSVGVNIFFAVNKQLAKLMATQPDYQPVIEEIHHTEKKDAPSGTAITLAEQLIEQSPKLARWTMDAAGDPAELTIRSERTEGVPGTHRVTYSSPIDTLEIVHTAHNRIGFATGAVLAAEFLAGKKGVFTMADVLGIGT
ncbi:MAG: 4-hydroxy-tetrahydrodipicolinate reductase [Bacteroidota bacterium]